MVNGGSYSLYALPECQLLLVNWCMCVYPQDSAAQTLISHYIPASYKALGCQYRSWGLCQYEITLCCFYHKLTEFKIYVLHVACAYYYLCQSKICSFHLLVTQCLPLTMLLSRTNMLLLSYRLSPPLVLPPPPLVLPPPPPPPPPPSPLPSLLLLLVQVCVTVHLSRSAFLISAYGGNAWMMVSALWFNAQNGSV